MLPSSTAPFIKLGAGISAGPPAGGRENLEAWVRNANECDEARKRAGMPMLAQSSPDAQAVVGDRAQEHVIPSSTAPFIKLGAGRVPKPPSKKSFKTFRSRLNCV